MTGDLYNNWLNAQQQRGEAERAERRAFLDALSHAVWIAAYKGGDVNCRWLAEKFPNEAEFRNYLVGAEN